MKFTAHCVLLTTLCFLPAINSALASDATAASLSLAVDLASETLHDLSALEFRRCSYMSSSQPEEKAGFLAAAGWEYKKASMMDLSLKMLDEAEASSRVAGHASLLIRGDIAIEQRRLDEAEFFFATLQESDAPKNYRIFAASRRGLIALKQGHVATAREHLESIESTRALEQLTAFESSRGRSPRIGGILGMVPGMGYAYSGEYANCLRSIILNGIFIYAMVETSDREQWGAFTALSFFELTWYTGSIYGGIDAAHRFNKKRETKVTGAIENEYDCELDLKAVPSITMEFSF